MHVRRNCSWKKCQENRGQAFGVRVCAERLCLNVLGLFVFALVSTTTQSSWDRRGRGEGVSPRLTHFVTWFSSKWISHIDLHERTHARKLWLPKTRLHTYFKIFYRTLAHARTHQRDGRRVEGRQRESISSSLMLTRNHIYVAMGPSPTSAFNSLICLLGHCIACPSYDFVRETILSMYVSLGIVIVSLSQPAKWLTRLDVKVYFVPLYVKPLYSSTYLSFVRLFAKPLYSSTDLSFF